MSSLERLPLTRLAEHCAQESELFFRRQACDPRFCFELFRRAIQERLPCAWELIYDQYHSLVTRWVNRHPSFPSTGEETAYFVNRAFERMWSALTPKKFDNFPDLKSLLRYLQMCVHSVIIDYTRLSERATLETELKTAEEDIRQHGSGVEEQVLSRNQSQAFWNRVQRCLHNDKERRIMYGFFVLGLKSQEVYASSRDVFKNVDEVYRTKQNLLARLRRDPELLELFGA